MKPLAEAAKGARDIQALMICPIWLVYHSGGSTLHINEREARAEYRARAAANETTYLCHGNGDEPSYSLAECDRCGNTYDHRYPCVQS